MKLYSTRNPKHIVSLQEAVFKGLADDGGLYLPTEIPVFEADFFKQIHQMHLQEIYLEVAKKWIGSAVPETELRKIIKRVFYFDIPIVQIHDNIFTLELFHGPTLAFKDVGAGFMAGLMAYFIKDQNKEINIVVATSGDTGSAVAAGFYDVPGINVFILYPKGKVSPLQEKQLTTWGKNIKAVEVEGTFDDCQALAKKLLSDRALNTQINISSANSINIARLIPQSFYYFSSYADLKLFGNSFAYSVPSGNFGNLTAGLLAKKMGLPIDFFIAATNVNDVFPNYLQTGTYTPKPSVETISNAMDVGNPSNFERMMDLYPEFEKLKQNIKSKHYTDDATRVIIKEVFEKYSYTMDPHGAVGYLALRDKIKELGVEVGVFLETAHPAKFKSVLDSTLNTSIEVPERLNVFDSKPKVAIPIRNNYDEIVQIIKVVNGI